MDNQKKESFEFQSEIKQLLQILVYSLYEHKDIFLRELISNASDALNKLQFELLTNEDIEDKDADLKISIRTDKDNNQLIIEDTGIGMTKEELIENIGTIAHSGTMTYLKQMSEQKDGKSDLIGKFGVGFYSAFMVADEISIYTKSFKKGSTPLLWQSKGDNSYSIEDTDKEIRGTKIVLSLKEEEKEFLEDFRLETIINKHSRFVAFPIEINEKGFESKPALWTQPKSNLKEEDYKDFYKFYNNAGDEPATWLHLSSDAPVQFNALLYIPKSNFEIAGFMKTDPGMDLYSKKVLIQKGCKDIIPEYLRFVKGVIDSEDIPLNISRETIQNNAVIAKIRKFVLKKLFEHLISLKKDKPEDYKEIWKNFSRNFKEGITSEFDYRDQLGELLLFNSSKKSVEETVDLKSYVENMQEDQEEIYYATGMDINSINRNPALEAFRKKDLEVLLLSDPLDEIVLDHLREYDKKRFKIVESADIKLDENDIENSADPKDTDSFVTYLKTIYGETIEDVKPSMRLVESPAILVQNSDGPSAQMEKMMKMVNKDFKYSKKTMEINPSNNLIKEMIRIHKSAPDSGELKSLALQLRDNLLLREGIIDDIDNIVPRLLDIMHTASKNI